MKIVNKEIYTEDQVRRVLTGAGIDIANELSSDFMVFCPYHSNTRTPAGEVSKEYGTFFCFGCQTTKTLVELVMHSSNRTYFEAMRYIKSKHQEVNIEDTINKALINKNDFIEYDQDMINNLNKNLMMSDRAKSYLVNRKITELSMSRFLLGYSEKQDMITIPVHSPDGIPLGFVARSIEGKDFKNTPGLPKGKVLFNLHRAKMSKTIYVVESSFDAIRLDQVGFPAVATLGANVSTSQMELLKKYFNDIILIADNDEAGKIMKDKLINKIGSKVSTIKLPQSYKDVGDMSDENIKSLQFQFDESIESMLK